MSSATLALNGAMTNHRTNKELAGGFHLAVAATILIAAAAVGIAGATTLPSASPALPAKKADRMPMTAVSGDFITIETRNGNTSVLARVPSS